MAPGGVREDDRPHRPEAGDRRLLCLQFRLPSCQPGGNRLAQVILGLGQDQLRLSRRGQQARPQLAEVLLNQVPFHT
jgi:hypothetical protein